jgi:flagellar motility protein MotE (MotC chaperone)
MKRLAKSLFTAMALVTSALPSSAFADDREEIRLLKERLAALEAKLNDQDKKIVEQDKKVEQTNTARTTHPREEGAQEPVGYGSRGLQRL